MAEPPCECGRVTCRLRLDNGRCAGLIANDVSQHGGLMAFNEMAEAMGLKSHQHAEQIYARAMERFTLHAIGMDLEGLLDHFGTLDPRVARLLSARERFRKTGSSI